MLFKLLLLCYASAIGFTAAGIVSSFYQLVTAKPVRFALLGDGAGAMFVSALFFAVCGPMIMFRTAVRARLIDNQSVGILCGGVAIAAIWGCCVGIVALDLVLSIGDTFA